MYRQRRGRDEVRAVDIETRFSMYKNTPSVKSRETHKCEVNVAISREASLLRIYRVPVTVSTNSIFVFQSRAQQREHESFPKIRFSLFPYIFFSSRIIRWFSICNAIWFSRSLASLIEKPSHDLQRAVLIRQNAIACLSAVKQRMKYTHFDRWRYYRVNLYVMKVVRAFQKQKKNWKEKRRITRL